MGEKARAHIRHHRRMAQLSAQLDVPRKHLQCSRHAARTRTRNRQVHGRR